MNYRSINLNLAFSQATNSELNPKIQASLSPIEKKILASPCYPLRFHIHEALTFESSKKGYDRRVANIAEILSETPRTKSLSAKEIHDFLKLVVQFQGVDSKISDVLKQRDHNLSKMFQETFNLRQVTQKELLKIEQAVVHEKFLAVIDDLVEIVEKENKRLPRERDLLFIAVKLEAKHPSKSYKKEELALFLEAIFIQQGLNGIDINRALKDGKLSSILKKGFNLKMKILEDSFIGDIEDIFKIIEKYSHRPKDEFSDYLFFEEIRHYCGYSHSDIIPLKDFLSFFCSIEQKTLPDLLSQGKFEQLVRKGLRLAPLPALNLNPLLEHRSLILWAIEEEERREFPYRPSLDQAFIKMKTIFPGLEYDFNQLKQALNEITKETGVSAKVLLEQKKLSALLVAKLELSPPQPFAERRSPTLKRHSKEVIDLTGDSNSPTYGPVPLLNKRKKSFSAPGKLEGDSQLIDINLSQIISESSKTPEMIKRQRKLSTPEQEDFLAEINRLKEGT